jgi:hypothetical protein
MSFRFWLPRQLPVWFQKVEGTAVWTPTAGGLDNVNFPNDPQPSIAPSDALDAIGFDRGLPRAPAEADATYAARLLGAWEAWKYGGSHYGILRALAIAGYADMIIVQQNGRYSHLVGSAGTIADLAFGTLMTCADRLNPPWTSLPPGWMFDPRQGFFSKFGIVFTADHANLQPNGDGSVSPGQAALVAIVNAWKPSKTAFDAAYVILAGILLGWPTGRTLGTDPNLGGNSVRWIPGDGSPSFVEGP